MADNKTGMDYTIDVLIFGSAPIPADVVYNGRYLQRQMTDNTFGMTLVRGEGRNILVDCGSNMDDPAKKAIYFDIYGATMASPQEALASAGLTPEDITDVVVTHAHMDHMGGLELFPNAHFFVQKDELEGWEAVVANPKMGPALTPGVLDPGDLVRARELAAEGRMTLLEGDVENLLPGIDVHVFPFAHSISDQVVVIRTKSGNFVDVGDISTRAKGITGVDEAPYYMVQDGAAGSIYLSMMAFPKILEWADNDIDHVILRHDVNYKVTRIQEFHEESVARYSFC